MIKLNKEYVIKFIPQNVILYRTSNAGEKAKKPGSEMLTLVGYFGSFEYLVNKLLNDKLLLEQNNSLQEVVDTINSFKKDILQSIIELNPDTRPYKYSLETDKGKEDDSDV